MDEANHIKKQQEICSVRLKITKWNYKSSMKSNEERGKLTYLSWVRKKLEVYNILSCDSVQQTIIPFIILKITHILFYKHRFSRNLFTVPESRNII